MKFKMKKAILTRVDEEIWKKISNSANKENRKISNYVETILVNHVRKNDN